MRHWSLAKDLTPKAPWEQWSNSIKPFPTTNIMMQLLIITSTNHNVEVVDYSRSYSWSFFQSIYVIMSYLFCTFTKLTSPRRWLVRDSSPAVGMAPQWLSWHRCSSTQRRRRPGGGEQDSCPRRQGDERSFWKGKNMLCRFQMWMFFLDRSIFQLFVFFELVFSSQLLNLWFFRALPHSATMLAVPSQQTVSNPALQASGC